MEKKLFLTFDDGPVPEVTPRVLDLLNSFRAKATFFCIGNNIEKHPAIFTRILSEGHAFGNHTFQHLNGWRTSNEVYSADTEHCTEIMQKQLRQQPRFFRPPYGRMTPAQYWSMKKRYKIVMWDVLTMDWEKDRSAESCFGKIIKTAVPGSIVVFHDSIKAEARMIPALKMTLDHFSRSGYIFESLENSA